MAQPVDPPAGTPKPVIRPASSSHGVDGDGGVKGKLTVDACYRRAVAAFKAQLYDQALTDFQALARVPVSSPYHAKALMGQVRVYQRLGDLDHTRAVCQQLQQLPSTQAQQWARQVLDQMPAANDGADSPPEDRSGFMPLDGSSQVRPPDRSPALAPAPAAAAPVRPSGDATPSQSQDSEFYPEDGSLFHYEQLNQRSPSEPDLPPPPTPDPANAAASPRSVPRSPQRPAALPRRPAALWMGQAVTAIALLWAIPWVAQQSLSPVARFLGWVRWPVRWGLPQWQPSPLLTLAVGLGLAAATPWIMEYLLTRWYGQKPLSTRQLQTHHPEALRLLRQVCRQQTWQMPELRILPDAAPLCFSYGWLARHTRIVVSQGLLDQCSAEEVTALYGFELGRMVNGSLPVLSTVGLGLLLLHRGHRWLARLGDRSRQPWVARGLGLLSIALYGLFWLLRQAVLWLSRLCVTWADRRATALTRRPDHLAAALMTLTSAIATRLPQLTPASPLYTSLEVLMPVGYRQALGPGSVGSTSSAPAAGQSALIARDSLNPYRRWLRSSASHPALGERLLWCYQQAARLGTPGTGAIVLPTDRPSPVALPLLLLQKAPLAGLVAGGGLAMGLWFVGGIVNRLGWQRVSWLYQDPSVLVGGLWLGLGLGLMLRINHLFPDPSPRRGARPSGSADTIAHLLSHAADVPVQGKWVTLKGQLRGLEGIGNCGCQDLYLDDSTGLVRLVDPVAIGSLQGLLQSHNHPLQWIGRSATVTGWGRYSAGMLWVDIDRIQLDQRHSFHTYGQGWATLVSVAVSLVGIFTILTGG